MYLKHKTKYMIPNRDICDMAVIAYANEYVYTRARSKDF